MKTKNLLLIGLAFFAFQLNAITINFTTVDESCSPGADGSINAMVSGGTPPYTYAWSNALPGVPLVTGLTAGTYTVTVTDAVASTQSASATVNAAMGPSVSVLIVGPSCPGRANGSITINTTSGTPPFTYLWSNSSTTNTQTNLVAGIYGVTVVDANGCSSVRTLTVADPFPQPFILTVSQNGDTLTADEPNASYQWLDCVNGMAPIIGDTSRTYIVVPPESVAVEITRSTCVDTSACINMTGLSLENLKAKDEKFKVFPNPSNGVFSISNLKIGEGEKLRIFDIRGKEVYRTRLIAERISIDLSDLDKGIYFIDYMRQKQKLILLD